MVNLGIAYESSDEEDVAPTVDPEKPVVNGKLAGRTLPGGSDTDTAGPSSLKPGPASTMEAIVGQGPINGPSLGPTAPPPQTLEGAPEYAVPASPYTSSRSLIRNLTLPTVPNFNIPGSPPGSPPQRPTEKFTQFLNLKKKGQHFNQRLEGSPVLRDPAHLRRLMDFAGVSDEEQYMSTLPGDVAVPAAFPAWAYAEELRQSQKKITKANEHASARIPREAIDFVAGTGPSTSSGTGTPSGKGVYEHQSAAERVIAGLERQQPGKRKELEQRGAHNASSSRGWRNRSRSPKRRRSRSRERR